MSVLPTAKERAAEQSVERIIDNLTGRSGLDHAWDDIDEDIQQEIKTTLVGIIVEELDKELP